MKIEIVENVAKILYADKRYEYKDMVEERSDAIAWLCEKENQDKLDELCIANDELAVLKFTKQIIKFKYLKYKQRVKWHYLNILDDEDEYKVDGLLYDNYSCENEAKCLKFNQQDEVRYMLDHLNEEETNLLIDLCSDVTYNDMTEIYNINYKYLKVKINRLRKKCKKLYNEALNKLF